MQSDQAITRRKRKDRSSIACEFCRRRKLGCDNARPRCENCQARNADCTYLTREKQARPTNDRIRKLEAENARLRQSLQADNSHTSTGHQNPEDPETLDQAMEELSPESHGGNSLLGTDRTLQRSPLGDIGQSLPSPPPPSRNDALERPQPADFLHENTSMFNEVPPNPHEGSGQSKFTDAHAKDHLLAATTRQRQLESINLKRGKLDFDGADPELCMQLLAGFWNRQHYLGSMVYRTAFMRDMACNGPYFSKFLLNAILFSAVRHSKDANTDCDVNKNEETGFSFRRKFEGYLYSPGSQILVKSSITTIQALMVISDVLLSWCDEKGLAWHYLGIAINMILDSGIHVEGGHSRSASCRSPEDLEIQRRVFWTAFVLDKVQSIYLGRPARLRGTDNRVPIEFLDDYDEYDQFSTLTFCKTPGPLDSPTFAISMMEQLCKLYLIADRVLYNLYSARSSNNSFELLRTLQRLRQQMLSWKEELPEHLDVQLDTVSDTPVLPHALCLLAMYHSMIILLHRPFVSDGHLQSLPASAASDAFGICATAAQEIHKILVFYQKRYCMVYAPYFISYATYVSATIHVRIASQRNSDSGAHKGLQNCLDVLGEHAISCHAPRRTMRILRGLMHRLNVNVGGDAGQDRIAQPGIPPPSSANSSKTLYQDEAPQAQEIWSTTNPTSLEPALNNFDIDEIIRSFNFESGEYGALSHSGLGDNQLMQGASIPGAISEEDDLGSFLFLDPLIGFDQ